MRTPSGRTACLAGVLALLAGAAPPLSAQQGGGASPPSAARQEPAPPDAGRADDPLEGVGFTLGDPDAPVYVVEFADFACEACGQFARDVWPDVRAEFVETGRVFWRVVPFELGFRNSDEGARAGQCGAELGDFWGLHDALYEAQHTWLGERRPKDRLVAVAASAGFDADAFRQCYDDNPGRDRVKAANRAARDRRVRATPTFFIDGFMVQGALPLEAFRALLTRG